MSVYKLPSGLEVSVSLECNSMWLAMVHVADEIALDEAMESLGATKLASGEPSNVCVSCERSDVA